MGNCEKARPASCGVPVGKFCLVPAAELCAAWSAYQAGEIRFLDLRVWLAGLEMLARRCTLARGRAPRYTAAELRRLVDSVDEESLRASVRRLTKAGIVRWTRARIEFSMPPGSESAGLSAMLAQVPNSRRRVPIPRRIIRYLAACRKPAVVATVLALCLRGLYCRAGQCHCAGTCKASWVAETFGVDARSVKRARHELAGLGWITAVPKPHWHRQRYGEAFIINLAWKAPAAPIAGEPGLSLRTGACMLELSPPDSHKELPVEVEHPEPPVAASPGVSAKWNAPPRLNRVVPADLEVPARTAELFNQAATRDLLTDSPSSRLNFFAAAARARRLGTRNPGGFFAAIVRRQLWHHISAADEDAARHRIAQVPDFLHVQRPSPPVRTSILPTAPADPLVIRELIRRSLDAATALPVAAA